MSDQELEAALLERARGGDAEAFNGLVWRYQRLLLSVALGLLEDQGRAEDAVQEAFLSAWTALPRYRGEASFRTWLCRILVNKALSARRWGRLRRWLSLDHPAADALKETLEDREPGADPEAARLQEERSAAVRAALASLPAQQRAAVLLRSSGLSVVEVAEAMSVAEGTIKAHLHAARARLSAALGDA